MEWNGNEGIWDSVLPDLGGIVVKNPPAKAGDTEDVGSIPGSGKSPGVGNGNTLPYSRPGKFRRQKRLVSYSPWGCRESGTTT